MPEFSHDLQSAENLLDVLFEEIKRPTKPEDIAYRSLAYQGVQALTLLSIAKSLETLASK